MKDNRKRKLQLRLINAAEVHVFRAKNADDGYTALPHYQYPHVDGILQNDETGEFVELEYQVITGG